MSEAIIDTRAVTAGATATATPRDVATADRDAATATELRPAVAVERAAVQPAVLHTPRAERPAEAPRAQRPVAPRAQRSAPAVPRRGAKVDPDGTIDVY
ncbi:MAG TPA: hypothetical protein VLM79_02895 [Kofleriaceae bacterium]|nr:hypothetical protein [Kofleriaceae bacterium]